MKNLQDEESIKTHLNKLYKGKKPNLACRRETLNQTISFWEDKLKSIEE